MARVVGPRVVRYQSGERGRTRFLISDGPESFVYDTRKDWRWPRRPTAAFDVLGYEPWQGSRTIDRAILVAAASSVDAPVVPPWYPSEPDQ